jgi:hypothetical protein
LCFRDAAKGRLTVSNFQNDSDKRIDLQCMN